MTNIYLTVLFSAVVLFSCKSASKAYEKGNYQDAIEIAIKRIQKDPYDAESQAMVKKAYAFAVTQHEDQIRILSGSNDANRYDRIYSQYNTLQNLYRTIRQYPSLIKYVNPTDYSSYLETYKNKAAEVHYEKALALMKEDDKEAYREAYREFAAALRLKPNTDSIRRQMEEAYEAALVNVVMLPMGNYLGGYQYSTSYELKNFQDDIMRRLRYQGTHEFIKFYTEWDARSRNIQPDEVLEMNLGRIIIGRPFDESKTRNVTKEVVVKETVYKPDSVVKQYAKVSAQIISTKRTLVSEGDLHVTARDTKGRILWNDVIRGTHTWQVEFATYKGDERALSDSDKASLNQKDYTVPQEDEILREVLRRIENEMQYRLRSHYSRYY